MQRESDQRKAEVYGRHMHDDVSTPTKPMASHVGTAKAAAKLAGGVFYTYAENAEMLERMKELRTEKDAMAAKLAKAEELNKELNVTLNKFANDALPDSDIRGKSPGYVRQAATELLRLALGLNAPSAAPPFQSPSFIRKASRLSGRLSGVAGDDRSNVSPVLVIRPPAASLLNA